VSPTTCGVAAAQKGQQPQAHVVGPVEIFEHQHGFHAQFSVQHGDADLVLPQRGAAPPLARIQPHERAR
jgi:hypothetical protein